MAVTILAAAALCTSAVAASVTLAPNALPGVATVDERYQSYNVELAEVVGAKFWKPYASTGKFAADGSRPPIDLADARLRRLAAALAPAYMRVSGSWANTVYFAAADDAPAAAPPGFRDVLTRREWAGVIAFARAVDAKIVTSFAISAGVRDAAGVWTPRQARTLLAYTKAAGGDIAAAEFFNEPSLASIGAGAPPGYGAADHARDFAVFRRFARTTAPGMLIVGPGSVGEGVTVMPWPLLGTADLLAAHPRPRFDVFSYHSYAAISERCTDAGQAWEGTTEAAALSEEWLSRPDRINAFYAALRDRFEPGKPIWITETAEAACGGNRWAADFLDSFRYLDQLGRLARRGVQVVFHNTLAASDYGLIDQETLTPRPNYWAALLWRRLMGRTVLDAGPPRSELHLYAHCLSRHAGGVALLAINTSRTRPQSIDLPLPAERYTLTAHKLDDMRVELNGRDLDLTAGDELPVIEGERVAAGRIGLEPASITFLAVADARNGRCK